MLPLIVLSHTTHYCDQQAVQHNGEQSNFKQSALTIPVNSTNIMILVINSPFPQELSAFRYHNKNCFPVDLMQYPQTLFAFRCDPSCDSHTISVSIAVSTTSIGN